MPEEEKTAIVDFLDLAADYLRDGHARSDSHARRDGHARKKNSSLPLAYMVEEPDSQEPSSAELDSLEAVAAEVAACSLCGLSAGRRTAVPGEGAEQPLVMVIGEGPGADEDAAGRPFVGKAGQLLDKMLGSIGLYREKNCYIANMVKCRPPGNRDPQPDEIAACFPFLERQIRLLKPRIILCAGRVAAQNLINTSQGINKLRGEFLELRLGDLLIPVLCTFHPSALLRDESLKRPAWEDLKLLKSRLPGGEA
ncbi:MAG: uracil-DNA glycosylase [Treponema sp.]|nr:uracil-DNA glycosylase [Treponema sp.]